VADWQVPATVVKVHDGDTLTVVADLGWRISLKTSVRLFGVNAPELDTPAGQASLNFVYALVQPGDEVTLVSHKLLGATEKYGRVLASVTLSDGRDLSTLLLQNDYAVPYGLS
jgi:endonuclease YncB( thermonuclease family)